MNIKRPAWMYFAAEVQKQLDKIKPSKGGKREEQFLYDAWRTASEKHGYAGSEFEWRTLLQRIGRGEIKMVGCS
jgi:hypothetical protein